MTFEEKKMDLFTVDDKYYLAHCISLDANMSQGIAVEFEKRFKLRDRLLSMDNIICPGCVRLDRVFNLITKRYYYGKPTYATLDITLWHMRRQALDLGVKYIAMPKIASGLDKLAWGRVKSAIKDIFAGTDIEILICIKPRR